MDRERELLHKVLDNEATDEEKGILAHRLEEDPRLREELGSLSSAVDLLEKSARPEVPPRFTARVMNRLHARRPSLAERMQEFFFGSRTLRWNLATVAVAALVLIVASVLFLRQERPGAPTASRQTEKQMVKVQLRFIAPQAKQVAIAGSFNRWSATSHIMQRMSGGVWSIEIPFDPGEYTYMFVVDGTAWTPDPAAEASEDDGFGRRNSVLRIGI